MRMRVWFIAIVFLASLSTVVRTELFSSRKGFLKWLTWYTGGYKYPTPAKPICKASWGKNALGKFVIPYSVDNLLVKELGKSFMADLNPLLSLIHNKTCLRFCAKASKHRGIIKFRRTTECSYFCDGYIHEIGYCSDATYLKNKIIEALINSKQHGSSSNICPYDPLQITFNNRQPLPLIEEEIQKIKQNFSCI